MRRWLARGLIATAWLGFGVPAAADPKAECLRAYEAAQRNRKAAKFRQARQDALSCLQPACPEVLRADCADWLEAIEKSTPTVVFLVRSSGRELSGVRVAVDGEAIDDAVSGAALPVDPGQRRFRFDHDDHPSVELSVLIREGEKNRSIAVDVPEERGEGVPKARAVPTSSIVLGSVGAVGLVGFGYFGVKGLHGRGQLDECRGRCQSSEVDAVRADFLRADLSLGLAALAFGAAAYFYFSADDTKESGKLRIGATARSGGGTAFAAFGF